MGGEAREELKSIGRPKLVFESRIYNYPTLVCKEKHLQHMAPGGWITRDIKKLDNDRYQVTYVR